MCIRDRLRCGGVLRRAHLMQKLHEAREGLIARGFVGGDGVARVLSGTHKSVTSAIVRDRIVEFAGGLHRIGGGGDGGADPGIVACIEAVNGSDDGRNLSLIHI